VAIPTTTRSGRLLPSTSLVTTVAALAGIPGAADGLGKPGPPELPFGIEAWISRAISLSPILESHNPEIDPTGSVSTLARSSGDSGGADGTGSAARFDSPSTWPWIGPETFMWQTPTITRSARWCLRPGGRVRWQALPEPWERRRIGIRGRIFPSGRIVFDSNGIFMCRHRQLHRARGVGAFAPTIQTTPQSQTVTAGSDVLLRHGLRPPGGYIPMVLRQHGDWRCDG